MSLKNKHPPDFKYHPLQESKNHCSTLTRRIAGIGSKGAYPGNCERDLFRVLNLPLET